MNFSEKLSAQRNAIEAGLKKCIESKDGQQTGLNNSMAYSLLAGGKRIRPILTLEFCCACGGSCENAMNFACGVEILHTYSLVHDDLPCMDDDDLRRGKPTNHIMFGECTAVLAGDALQTLAFEQVLRAPLPAQQVVSAARELSRAAGKDGMCAGQFLDMEGEGHALTLEELTMIHRKKTGALLEAACVMGVIAAGGTREQCSAARRYAEHIGIAFQIRDDMLDMLSTTEQLGKPIGSDAENQKTTFAFSVGVEECERMVIEHTKAAQEIIHKEFPGCDFLVVLADWLAGRMY